MYPEIKLYRQLRNLKWMVNSWVDKVFSRAARAPVVHPWLPLPCSMRLPDGFSSGSCWRSGDGGRGKDEEEKSKEFEEGPQLHFCFKWLALKGGLMSDDAGGLYKEAKCYLSFAWKAHGNHFYLLPHTLMAIAIMALVGFAGGVGHLLLLLWFCQQTK